MSVSLSQSGVAVGLALLILAVACGGDDGSAKPSTRPESDLSLREAGEREFREYISLIADGDWGTLWSHLYPAHKDAVTQAQFVDCFAAATVELTEIEVEDVYEQGITIPSTTQTDATVALSARIEWLIDDERYQQRQVFHVLPVADEWYWLLADPGSYDGGACPDDPLPAMF